MSGELSSADVGKVARLARLEVDAGEAETLRGELAAVLGYVERLRELDLRDVEPLADVGEEVNRLRDDEPGPALAPEVLMELAPDTIEPYLRVPKVLGEGGG